MGRRLALLIGNNEYLDKNKFTPLTKPAQNVEDLAKVLSDPKIGKFEVTKIVNEPLKQVQRAIALFYRKSERDDLLLLYFAGHGQLDNTDALYLAVQDTEHDFLEISAIPATFIANQMGRSKSKQQVLILDSCHSGAFPRSADREAPGATVVVLTASDKREFSFEYDENHSHIKHSVFTHYIIQGLQTGEADANKDGEITVDELYAYVHTQMEKTKQSPLRLYPFHRQGGKIVIAYHLVSPPTELSLPDWLAELLASEETYTRLIGVIQLARLKNSQDKDLADLVHTELKRLNLEDKNSIVRGAAAGALGIFNFRQEVEPKPRTSGALSVDEWLSQATCAIMVDGEIIGTAWLISDDGYLITAGHVLGLDEPIDEVEVRFIGHMPQKAQRIVSMFDQERGIDFAILKLATPLPNLRPLPISLARSVNGRFKSCGYGKTLGDQSIGLGEFVGVFYRNNSQNSLLFRLRSPELAEEGYSGAAIFSEDLQAIVGIQTEVALQRVGAGRDTILAMPLYRIAEYWEFLLDIATV